MGGVDAGGDITGSVGGASESGAGRTRARGLDRCPLRSL